MKKAEDFLIEIWKEDGKKVVDECSKAKPFEGSMNDFLSHCTAMGGNWGGMLLSGLKEIYPSVWDAIPDNMGTFAWAGICSVLELLNILEGK